MDIISFARVKILYMISDWNIATPRQHHWRRSMLENFSALFNIAESFKSILIERSETFNTISHNEISDDAFPSLETLWKAYVCTGTLIIFGIVHK